MSLYARVSVEYGDFTIISSDFRKFTISVGVEKGESLSVDFELENGAIKFVQNDLINREDASYYAFESAFIVYLADQFNIETNYTSMMGASVEYFQRFDDIANDNIILGAAEDFVAIAASAA